MNRLDPFIRDPFILASWGKGLYTSYTLWRETKVWAHWYNLFLVYLKQTVF